MSSQTLLSNQLETIIGRLSPHCGTEEVTLSGQDFDHLVRSLAVIRKGIVNMEREVGAFRLAEAARSGRVVVEQLATEAAGTVIADSAGNVVRPDFGRKP